MAEITIRHTHEDGTLVEGMERGDGTYEIICAKYSGFRWFRTLATAGIPQSRDRVAKRHIINPVVEKLRAAGHTVEVVINDEHRDRATVLADQAARLDDRHDALERKAQRRTAESEAAFQRADSLLPDVPQPILVGHHSERRHRRALEKADAAMARSVEAGRDAAETARRAAAVGSAAAYSAKPGTTARRIKTLEAELRDIDRKLNGYTTRHLDGQGQPVYVFPHEPAAGDWREQIEARRAQIEDQLAYDRAALANAVAEGRWTQWGPDNVHKGDIVAYWGGGRTVVKVNKVTVSCESGYSWHDKVKFTDIKGVRCPHKQDDGQEPHPLVEELPLAPSPDPTPAPAVPSAADATGGTIVAQSADGQPVIVAEYRHINAPAPAGDARRAAAAEILDAYKRGELTTTAVDYFPTPAALAGQVIDRHTQIGDLPDGARVLEPSAGDGALVRAVLAANGGVHVTAVEPTLRAVGFDLSRVAWYRATFEEFVKGYTSDGKPLFDAVVMNPPFNLPGQASAWIDHVRLAWDLVAQGGRLTAIVPAGFTFRADRAHPAMRDLVDTFGGHVELPADAFGRDGIRTVVIWLDRPVDVSALRCGHGQPDPAS